MEIDPDDSEEEEETDIGGQRGRLPAGFPGTLSSRGMNESDHY